jgi:hypothetical protein
METELTELINRIKQIKTDLYQRYKPELIDGIPSLTINCNVPENNDESFRSKEYERLMREQRQLIYKHDYEAQEKAKGNMYHKKDFKSLRDDVINPQTQLCELQKPWNKLSNTLKIQAVLGFIELLSPHLTSDQTNQLRFLLISSISNKKINKIVDVTYNDTKGQLEKIHRLAFDGKVFCLTDNTDKSQGIGLTSFQKPVIKKKLTLLKTNA